jgi:GNAT superfamily N-acetyltransferase
MRIQIARTNRQNPWVDAFISTTVRLLAPVQTWDLLFSKARWLGVDKVAIAFDKDEKEMMVGIAGVAPARTHGLMQPYPAVSAIWVAPNYRRKKVGLALLSELSYMVGGATMQMDMLSLQAVFLCEQARRRGIRIRYADTSHCWLTVD